MEGLPGVLLQMGMTRTGLRLAQMQQMAMQQQPTQLQASPNPYAMMLGGAGHANPWVGAAGPTWPGLA
jgi:hypothetical protein